MEDRNLKDIIEVQKKIRKKWENYKAFFTEITKEKQKFYCLEMFPYPSGKLHMGHLRNYSIGDAIARFKRMQGFNVLYPMGYDSFGLPAENAAIQHGIHPKEWTEKCIEEMKEQQLEMGFSYDWQREIATHRKEYYRWNQYFFLKFFEKGLVYRKKAPANFCKHCNTVLANEQVIQGKCWRCNNKVEIKLLEQWFIKITDYAEELLNSLKELDWPERVKAMQRNWIGKSEGTIIKFPLFDSEKTLDVFTTRIDTIYGVTFLVIAPEHELTLELVKGTEREKEVEEFINKVILQERFERTSEEKSREGIFLGKYAINPLTNEKIPIYTAPFVLADYGTGIVMAVPAHDQRDFEFAKAHGIPIKVVIQPKDGFKLNPEKMARAFTDYGVLENSGEFSGLTSEEAIEEITKYLEERGIGKKVSMYKLRDWLISRQRYWGTPIPIVYCNKCGIVPVPYEKLPVELPDDIAFGKGNPLETSESFVNVKCPKCNSPARRETDTMDTFFDSSWYFLRYLDARNSLEPFSKEKVDYWMPVDLYIGGIEHACLHLIYARFFCKALRDLGFVNFDEPFKRLLTQGMVLKDGAKMSKSLGNIVDPGEIITKYGADTARLFILSAAMPDKDLEWSDKGVESCYRLVVNIYNLVKEFIEGKNKTSERKDRFIISKLNLIIKDITNYIEEFKFPYAIQKINEFIHYLNKYKNEISKEVAKNVIENLALLINPFMPYLSEHIWELLNKDGLSSLQRWPKYDESLIDVIEIYSEDYLSNLISDISEIKKIIKKEPEKITLFVAEEWKYKLVNKLQDLFKETRVAAKIMQELMQDNEFKQHAKEIAKIIQALLKDPSRLPEVKLTKEDEIKILNNIKEDLKKEFKVEIVIETDIKHEKARQAMPGKPAILLN